jgi:branched-chain amino acid transport system ATP-binding protein
MGVEESLEIIKLLSGLKSRQTILLIEHDMNAVFTLADRVTVLVYGRVVASGPPEEIRANPDVRRAYLGEDEDT